jgi:iron complex outermembrane recepter protein
MIDRLWGFRITEPTNLPVSIMKITRYSKTTVRRLLPLCLGIQMLLQGHLAAQQGEDIIDLDAYRVSAQKREQSLFEVPINISTFQGSFLEENLGVSEFADLAAFVPGLEIQEQSPNNPGFVIRGITSDTGVSFYEPRVSVYLDGVSISDTRTSIVQLYDLERIEVAKGPQSTLFGRAAEIGAVSVLQARPHLSAFSGKVALGFGNHSERFVQGMVNQPLVEDTLAVRFAFNFHKREGYIENMAGQPGSQNPGVKSEPLNGLENRSFKIGLAWEPSERIRMDYLFNYQNDNPSGTSFKSGTYAPTGGDRSPNSAAELNLGAGLYIDRTLLNHNLTARFTMDDHWTFTSITGYRDTDSYEKFDADGTAAPVLEFAEDVQHEQFSQEFRINYESGERFSAFAGINFFYKNASQRVPFDTDERSLLVLLSSSPLFKPVFQAFGLPVDLPLILPDGTVFRPISALPNPFQPGSYLPLRTAHHEEFINDTLLKSWEYFVDGTWKLTGKTEITAGLRLSMEQVESGYEVVDSPTPGILGLVDRSRYPNNILISTGGKRISGDDNFSGVVGRAALMHAIDADNKLYTSIAKGRRPNVLVADETGISELSDETVWNYEAGIKGLLANQRISYDASVFLYHYSNFQTSIPNPNPPPLFEQVDAGNATGHGFELTAAAILSSNIRLFGNYAYIDATFDDKDDQGNPQIFAGNRFRLTPKHAFAVGFEVSYDLNDHIAFTFTPTFSWKSKVFFEDDNDSVLSQDGYGLLNLRAGLLFGESRSWDLSCYVSNALDKEYIIDAGNTGNTFGIPTFIAGPPMFYGIRLSKSF